MSNMLFDGLFEKADPHKIFADLGSEHYIYYSEVLLQSAAIANVLIEAGVKVGDRVVAQAPKSMDALMLYLASIRVGAVYVPLNTAYTVNEVEYFLRDANPRVFVCDPKQSELYATLAETLDIHLETLGDDPSSAGTLLQKSNEASTEFSNVVRKGGDLAAILYTSGTTGRSKGAMLTQGNLLSNAELLTSYWKFTQRDCLLHALPIFHTHGLFVATNIVLKANASMIFLPRFDIDQIIASLPKATAMMGVPTFYTRLLDDERLTKTLVSNFRLFISGSAPLLAETHTAFEVRTGFRILERYGMTETNMNTSNPYNGQRKPGTVGPALPGVEVRITDSETCTSLAQGETGMIEVRGPNVFRGYWQMPEKTGEELRDNGFFITGDLGYFDEDGYLQIVGRNKDLIISGGYNIYPKEVELALDEDESILESAVIGVSHADFGEAVVAVVVAAKDIPIDKDQILTSISRKLARFKQPRDIFVVDQLPRNAMGKVQKNLLRSQFKSTFIAI
ncbi:MAG: malonyl-CoA synthase [Gammaproteobacteria bacterium]|nr:malonyl-CoA synthase [Gammaproteobacteria bacterium]